jgi:hypothetical protein
MVLKLRKPVKKMFALWIDSGIAVITVNNQLLRGIIGRVFSAIFDRSSRIY